MGLRRENLKIVGKLSVIALGMFAFGYALVPIYRHICEALGINVLAVAERRVPGAAPSLPANTQVDRTRTITVEFDTNVRGPWDFKPAVRSMQVHPGELTTVVYEFQNIQNRTMAAQAIPSYAPRQAGNHFNKLECFCFTQYTLAPGEKKEWPVAFVIDPRLPKDVTTITLSYTFFEVGGKVPAAPSSQISLSPALPVPVAVPVATAVKGAV
ncbi:MAG: cytochrome c oxidase assembly protein [Hydrogenophaga sp.]|nr:cytochrome c oxidase assembly protein [Comamonadaceae bacterium]MBS4036594.1 cytochrome c oxidase assembly protein [Hydrogenophaga sp.]